MISNEQLSLIDVGLLIEIIKNQSHFIAILGVDGRIVTVNNTALDFVGLDEKDVIGQYFWDTQWWSHSEELQGKIKQAICDITSTDIVGFEVTNIDARGKLYTLDFSLKPIKNDAGEIIYLLPEGRDITEIRSLEAEFKESEDGYKKIFQSISDILFIADKNGRILVANKSACDVYGYTSREFAGMDATKIVHPDYHHVLDRFFDDLHKTGEFYGQTQEVRKNGTSFYAEVKGTRIQYDGKECFLAILRDISKRRQVEEALREREQLYHSLFQNNTSMILLINPETARIIDANPAACSFYGYPLKKLRRMRITDINVLSEEAVKKEMELARCEERNYFNFQHRLADGSLRDVEVFSGPIEVEGKAILCSIIHDITERKKNENERGELIRELQTALDEIKTLKGIIPICASCKNIRDDKGYWNKLEIYLKNHSDAELSHSICPDCVKLHYPDIADDVLDDEEKS